MPRFRRSPISDIGFVDRRVNIDLCLNRLVDIGGQREFSEDIGGDIGAIEIWLIDWLIPNRVCCVLVNNSLQVVVCTVYCIARTTAGPLWDQVSLCW